MKLKFKKTGSSTNVKTWECDSYVGDFKIIYDPEYTRGDRLIYIHAELNEGDDEIKYSGYPRYLASWDEKSEGPIHEALEEHLGYILNSMITALTEEEFKNITIELEK